MKKEMWYKIYRKKNPLESEQQIWRRVNNKLGITPNVIEPIKIVEEEVEEKPSYETAIKQVKKKPKGKFIGFKLKEELWNNIQSERKEHFETISKTIKRILSQYFRNKEGGEQ